MGACMNAKIKLEPISTYLVICNEGQAEINFIHAKVIEIWIALLRGLLSNLAFSSVNLRGNHGSTAKEGFFGFRY